MENALMWSKKQVCEFCSFSKASLVRYESGVLADGTIIPVEDRFPQHVRHHGRVFYKPEEVRAWTQKLFAKRKLRSAD